MQEPISGDSVIQKTRYGNPEISARKNVSILTNHHCKSVINFIVATGAEVKFKIG